ncbi:MAG: tetratricopeptide repeat protein [Bacteroidota bacterium]|nr:tetratricopeptide repeat protein [Bacteroidota bacterium]
MRRSIKYLFLLAVILVTANHSYAQKTLIDSVLNLVKTVTKQDTILVNNYIFLCGEYRKIGDNQAAMQYGNLALTLAKQLQYKKGCAYAYNNIGNIYAYQSNHSKALENYLASTKINEELGNKKGIAAGYVNMAYIFSSQNNYEKALESNFAALKIFEGLGNKKGIAQVYNNIGTIYKKQGLYAKALDKFLASLKLKEEVGDKKGIVNSQINIGDIYFMQGDLNKSLEHYSVSLKMSEALQDKFGIAGAYYNIGRLLVKQNKIAEARKQFVPCLQISNEIGSKDLIAFAYSGLAMCDSAQGNYKGALDYCKLHKEIIDSIYNEDNTKKTAQMSAQYESEKKDNEIKLLNKDKEKQAAISEAESKKQRIIIWSVACGLILVIFFSVFIYNRWRITQQQKLVIEEQKEIVDEKQKEILDSIYYAKRIQTSLLPSEKYIEKNLTQLKKLIKK